MSFSGAYVEEKNTLHLLDICFSKHSDNHFLYMISFVVSQQLYEELLLPGSLENSEI